MTRPGAEAVAGNLEFGGSLTEVEVVHRTMAKEDRFARRLLATDYLERADRMPNTQREVLRDWARTSCPIEVG